jgi:hypothetical protein
MSTSLKKGRALAADEQQFRLAPPPADISQPVSVACLLYTLTLPTKLEV